MKHTEHVTRIRIFESKEELGTKVRLLIERATAAAQLTYSPYSRYPVGAALLLQDDTVVHGSNQENASYPVGICAERVALAVKAMEYPGKKIMAIAIKVNGIPSAPCGMYRQALLEVEHCQAHHIQVYLQGNTGEILEINSIEDLLPLPFFSKKLG